MSEVLNEKITLVSVNISTFSGYRRATREHIAALGGSLPNSAAITEGSIKVFPAGAGTMGKGKTKSKQKQTPMPITAMQTIRRSIFRELQVKGVKALGSQNVFAILTDELPEVEKNIADAKAKFAAERSRLDATYEQIFEAHVAANVEAETIIRSLKVDRSWAIGRCCFGSDVFRIAPFVREGQTEADGVEGIVRGLGRQLFEEIAAEMVKVSRSESFDRQKVGQKSLRPIKAAAVKMAKMSFLEPTLASAASLINETLSTLPKQGYILGEGYAKLIKLVDVLSDADDMVNAASKVANGMSVGDVLFPPVEAIQPEPIVAEIPEVSSATGQVVALQPKHQQALMLPPVSTPSIGKVGLQKVAESFMPKVVTPPSVSPRVMPPILKSRAVLKNNALLF